MAAMLIVFESTKYPGLEGTNTQMLKTAEGRIAQTLGGVSYLDLSNLRIISLPEVLGDCTEMKEFNCSFNRLTSLPSAIGKCAALKVITCDNNQITDLPVDLDKCTLLERIECGCNPLTSVPPSLRAIAVGLSSTPPSPKTGPVFAMGLGCWQLEDPSTDR